MGYLMTLFWVLLGFVLFSVAFHLWTIKTEAGKAFAKKLDEERANKKAAKQNRELTNRTIPPIEPTAPPTQPDYFQSTDYYRTRSHFNNVSNDTTVYPMTHHMKYMNRDGRYSERDIGVVRSYRKNKRWYIDAYCYNRHEVRTFAVENILELEDLMAGNIYTQPNLIRESLKGFEE
ncbi:hypothetical protein A9306_09035 [Moraxella atlantae]|uniref:WYL domain-containing protein n=2 Tax=Faucicola atlantae TaxID=34059 RepID=A0A1B8QCV0_9GAMM|nr:hypothetical protein A9306_09035 [Moraxella atlantae]